MPTIEQTIELIKEAHASQTYGDGPYWKHPYDVMSDLPSDAPEEVRHAALLHDVIEDTEYTASDLIEMGYSEYTVWLVEGLSRPSGDNRPTYMDWMRDLANKNDIWLIRIKMIDNKRNLSSRPEMVGRYGRSLALLGRKENELLRQINKETIENGRAGRS